MVSAYQVMHSLTSDGGLGFNPGLASEKQTLKLLSHYVNHLITNSKVWLYYSNEHKKLCFDHRCALPNVVSELKLDRPKHQSARTHKDLMI